MSVVILVVAQRLNTLDIHYGHIFEIGSVMETENNPRETAPLHHRMPQRIRALTGVMTLKKLTKKEQISLSYRGNLKASACTNQSPGVFGVAGTEFCIA